MSAGMRAIRIERGSMVGVACGMGAQGFVVLGNPEIKRARRTAYNDFLHQLLRKMSDVADTTMSAVRFYYKMHLSCGTLASGAASPRCSFVISEEHRFSTMSEAETLTSVDAIPPASTSD